MSACAARPVRKRAAGRRGQVRVAIATMIGGGLSSWALSGPEDVSRGGAFTEKLQVHGQGALKGAHAGQASLASLSRRCVDGIRMGGGRHHDGIISKDVSNVLVVVLVVDNL